jgi:hypothetical protein
MKVDRAGEGAERLEALLSTIPFRQAGGNEPSKPERVDQRIAS